MSSNNEKQTLENDLNHVYLTKWSSPSITPRIMKESRGKEFAVKYWLKLRNTNLNFLGLFSEPTIALIPTISIETRDGSQTHLHEKDIIKDNKAA